MTFRQRFSTSALLVLVTTFASFTTAQQSVLTSGNGALPACAAQCVKLQQASDACSGEPTTAALWNCFCQSGYLTTLYTSPAGICDTVCTDATDNTNVMNWYKSNCGTDDGASEHTNAPSPSSTATTTTATASSSTSAAPTASSTSKSGTTNTGSSNTGVSSSSDANKSWIDTHYQWIIFLVVVIVGFGLITLFAVWFKRRHQRKQDQIHGGFNAGVSERAPPMTNAAYNHSGPVASINSRAQSPQRTRDAFMPYGYNYSRSQTRLASQSPIPAAYRRSPLARGGTPINDVEKDTGMGVEAGTPSSTAPDTLGQPPIQSGRSP